MTQAQRKAALKDLKKSEKSDRVIAKLRKENKALTKMVGRMQNKFDGLREGREECKQLIRDAFDEM